jgi:hypothetical protein
MLSGNQVVPHQIFLCPASTLLILQVPSSSREAQPFLDDCSLASSLLMRYIGRLHGVAHQPLSRALYKLWMKNFHRS